MSPTGAIMAEAPRAPLTRLAICVTGHRRANAAMAGSSAAVANQLEALFDEIAAHVAAEASSLAEVAPIRVHTLLADGVEQIAAAGAVARGWWPVSTFPFPNLPASKPPHSRHSH